MTTMDGRSQHRRDRRDLIAFATSGQFGTIAKSGAVSLGAILFLMALLKSLS